MRKPDGFPKAVQRRFEFIEWKTFWDGGVRRESLEKAFGISTPQASVDLRHYQEIAPRNLDYDKQAKAYVAAPRFVEKLLTLSADRLLLQLRAYLMGALRKEDLWFATLPTVDAVPDIVRTVEPKKLRGLLAAIRQRQQITIEYQSLTNSRRRQIAPHALAFDGHRWHVRALCCENDDFRDFVITRIGELGEAKPADFDPAADHEWNRTIELRLIPHPGLTHSQRQAIECDYGMEAGVRVINIRLALTFYFIKRLNLDLEPTLGDGVLSPQRLQIQLENYAEVRQAIETAKTEAAAMVRARKALRAMET